MKISRRALIGIMLVFVVWMVGSSKMGSAEEFETVLVSRASGPDGVAGNWDSSMSAMSADARLVAFSSEATNLDPPDTNESGDVFLRDLRTNLVTLVSRADGSNGVKGNSWSDLGSMSADGRYVAFASSSTNLDESDGEGLRDVYVRDIQAHDVILVSRASGAYGVKGNGFSGFPSISADGRLVAFSSRATNLHPDTDPVHKTDHVFVRDLRTHEVKLISRSSGADGPASNGAQGESVISANGRYVAFSSNATNLHPDDSDFTGDIFVRDLRTDEVSLVSRASGSEGSKGDSESSDPAISADGRYVAFSSFATNLHPDAVDSSSDVFVRDLLMEETILVSRAAGLDGVDGSRSSTDPVISANGRYVAFSSGADNLHIDDTDSEYDVFLRDLWTGSLWLVSRASGSDGAKGEEDSGVGSMSEDGRYVTFSSYSSNLHPEDGDGTDVFYRDVLGDPELRAVSAGVDPEPVGSNGNGVLEPGELVAVTPSWVNDSEDVQELEGEVLRFVGPGDGPYTVVDGEAGYGTLAPGQMGVCGGVNDCYEVHVGLTGERPRQHWDTVFEEVLSDEDRTSKAWRLHIGWSFEDVRDSDPFYRHVEMIFHNGVGSGCDVGLFCPGVLVTRAAMAVFVLRSFEGRAFVPRECVEGLEEFGDVPFDTLFCPWIEELSRRGVVSGCGDNRYCPGAPVTRAQAAVFMLSTQEGPGFSPLPCVDGSKPFDDVPTSSPFCPWIQELGARSVTSGCGGGNFCPTEFVSRGQMSVFLARNFGLSAYTP